MDSSTSSSGLRVVLLFVGGSLELLVFRLLEMVGHVGALGAEEHDTQCFSEGDLIGGGSVIVKAVPGLSKLASMYRNTKLELPGGSGLADKSLLRLSMTGKLKRPTSHVHQGCTIVQV